ncbi:MAG: hypothetical protein C0407_10900 [Desulfobacca sp.]|nr:hypothetical protein [Desulfobacca sp.]
MKPNQSSFLIVLGTLVLSLSLSLAQPFPSAKELEQTIQYLLDQVVKSECTFIRNEKYYGAKEAAEHLKAKAKHYKKEIQTPEDFIRLAGTKSLITGDDYYVRTKEGKELRCADWLKKILADYVKKQKEFKSK